MRFLLPKNPAEPQSKDLVYPNAELGSETAYDSLNASLSLVA